MALLGEGAARSKRSPTRVRPLRRFNDKAEVFGQELGRDYCDWCGGSSPRPAGIVGSDDDVGGCPYHPAPRGHRLDRFDLSKRASIKASRVNNGRLAIEHTRPPLRSAHASSRLRSTGSGRKRKSGQKWRTARPTNPHVTIRLCPLSNRETAAVLQRMLSRCLTVLRCGGSMRGSGLLR